VWEFAAEDLQDASLFSLQAPLFETRTRVLYIPVHTNPTIPEQGDPTIPVILTLPLQGSILG